MGAAISRQGKRVLPQRQPQQREPGPESERCARRDDPAAIAGPGRRAGGELPAGHHGPVRPGVPGDAHGVPAAGLRVHFRLRARWPVSRADGVRSNSAGVGWVDGDYRRRRRPAREGGGGHRRYLRRDVRGLWCAGGAARPRAHRTRAAGGCGAVGWPDFVADLQCRDLFCYRRRARPAGQRASHDCALSGVSHEGRLHQRGGRQRGHLAALL